MVYLSENKLFQCGFAVFIVLICILLQFRRVVKCCLESVVGSFDVCVIVDLLG